MYEKPEPEPKGPRPDWERVHRVRSFTEIFKLENKGNSISETIYQVELRDVYQSVRHFLMDVAHALRMEGDIHQQTTVERVIDILDRNESSN